jgi:hypothetical protein
MISGIGTKQRGSHGDAGRATVSNQKRGFRRAKFGRVEETLIKLRSPFAVPQTGAIAQLGERIVAKDGVSHSPRLPLCT